MTTHELVTPTSPREWQAYHDIRRRVLFEERGQFGVYDENRPDEKAPNHYPKLLVHQAEPVGVVRIDIENDVAILRRVAIRTDVQRRGHGRTLLQLAQRFAEEAGCDRLASYVTPSAVGFYQSFGFAIEGNRGGGLSGHEPVFMTKQRAMR